MKKQLLTAIAVVASLCGYAQTKGTNALGFGVNVHTSKNEMNATDYTSENNFKNFSLSYGYFVKDNAKLGIELNYGNTENINTNGAEQNSETYGGNVTYQQYYPLVGKLFAYAGGRAGYGRLKNSAPDANPLYHNNVRGSQYSVGAYGGITWFVSKRFALETTLLSANATYGTYGQEVSGAYVYSNKQTDFNLSTSGLINDLGFKIYLLF